MASLFPDEENFRGMLAPLRIEGDVFDLEIDGEVPSSLDGTFFRVTPDPCYAPFVKDDILFNGDGLVSAFRISGGHVDFKQRYAQTPKFKAERAARRALFGAYRNPFTDDPSVAGMNRTTSNTHVYVHAGKLLALKEDGPPTAMDPLTLETHGEERFAGKMTGDTFTAHPKIDPVSGELIAFGYEAKGLGSADIVFYTIDPQGALTREVWLKAPHASMVHDWGVTQNFVVFPIMPLCSDVERMKQGLPRFVWRKDLDQYYGVLPRNGDASDVKWFRLPNGFQAHTFNAFDDGHMVYLDMTIASDCVFPFFPDANGHAPHMMTIEVNVTRVAMNMNTGEVSTTILTSPDRIMGDFPSCDPRYVSLPYRYGFMNSIDPSQDYDYDRLGPPPGMFFNGFGRLDVATGNAQRWWAGPVSGVQEPVFVPRSDDAPEGDGYILAVVDRYAENRSDLVIVDTNNIEGDPVATAKLPFRLRIGLHGSWAPAAKLGL